MSVNEGFRGSAPELVVVLPGEAWRVKRRVAAGLVGAVVGA